MVDMPYNKTNQTKSYIYIYIYIYLIYMFKEDLALNGQQSLICLKTKLNQIIYV